MIALVFMRALVFQPSHPRHAVRVTARVPHYGLRSDGGKSIHLRVIAEAAAGEFVGSKRLEQDWPGYSWRSALSPGFFR